MKISLFFKIYIPVFLIIATILMVYGFLNFKQQKDAYLNLLLGQAKHTSKSIVLNNNKNIFSNDKAQLITNSLEFLKEHDLVKYIIFDKKENFNLYIKKDSFDLSKKIPLSYKKEHNSFELLKSSLFPTPVFHYSYEIKVSKFLWGYLHLGLSIEDYNKQLDKLFKSFLSITLFSLLFSMLIIYLFSRWISIPISNLSKSVNRVSKGKFNKIKYKFNTKDEIFYLTSDFNKMVSHLKKSETLVKKYQENLEKKVEQRTKELNELNKNLDKKVQEELEKRRNHERYIYEQSKMALLGEMLFNISHQWKQPLSVITLGLSGIKLKRDLNSLDDKEFDKTYDLIMENTKYLTNTMDSFTKYAQEDKIYEFVDLKELISNIVLLNKDILNQNEISVNQNLADDISLKTMPNLLSQAFLHILLNANNTLKAKKEENRKIDIVLKKQNDSIIIYIEDNAGGIDDKELSSIFKPYHSIKNKYKESALGLFLSYDIIVNDLKAHLELININEGSRFIIILPNKNT